MEEIIVKDISLFIVIPVHNRKNFTFNCLFSLQNQTEKNFRTIVVDDGSTDGTSEMIETQFPDVILLTGDGNLWWTGATNLGIKYALANGATKIMTLNNDTIPTYNFIEKMNYWVKKYPDSLLGAYAINSQNNEPIYGGEIIDWKTATYKSLLTKISEEDRNGLFEVTHFPGRGLLIPKKAFTKVGLFNENLFLHYAADFDFTHNCVRNGFKVYINFDAIINIFPEESGGVQLRKIRSLKNYYNHLFGRKGAANLFIFTKYAIRNCPIYYLPSFLIFGYLKRIFGYWSHS
jgi:GT2 family glycosyltransferase